MVRPSDSSSSSSNICTKARRCVGVRLCDEHSRAAISKGSDWGIIAGSKGSRAKSLRGSAPGSGQAHPSARVWVRHGCPAACLEDARPRLRRAGLPGGVAGAGTAGVSGGLGECSQHPGAQLHGALQENHSALLRATAVPAQCDQHAGLQAWQARRLTWWMVQTCRVGPGRTGQEAVRPGPRDGCCMPARTGLPNSQTAAPHATHHGAPGAGQRPQRLHHVLRLEGVQACAGNNGRAE